VKTTPTINETPPSAAKNAGRNIYVWLLEPTILYWTIVGMHAGILRREYVIRAEELNSTIFFDEVANNDNTEVLQALVNQRNQLKHEIRERGNPIFTEWAAHRNTVKYGDKLGPNLDYLYKRQEEKHPDWTAAQIRTEVLKGVSRTNADVNDGMMMLEYGSYTFAIFLLLRLILTMAKSRRGEGLLAGAHVLGSWILGSLGVLTGVSFGIRYVNYDMILWAGLGAGILVSFILVFIWDRIFKFLYRKLQDDITAVNKLRP
jgi:hypothetical protein